VVVLENGDHLTGEIKKLDRGRLELSTDDMGTVYIEWEHIDQISSKQRFDIEAYTGQRFISSIREATEKKKMLVYFKEAHVPLDMSLVIRISPLEESIWQRVKGYVDMGFSFAKAKGEKQWSLGSRVSYRTRRYLSEVNVDSYFSDEENAERTSENTLGFLFNRFLSQRWVAGGLAQYQQNDEFDLELRILIGGGAGRHMIQTNSMNLTFMGGVARTEEKFEEEDESSTYGELIGSISFETFRFDNPELDLTSTFDVFYNLSTRDRVRMEAEVVLRYEIFNDFFWGLRVTDSYDSDPKVAEPEEDITKNDYRVSTTVGWYFK
jgi:hypothetical protein